MRSEPEVGEGGPNQISETVRPPGNIRELILQIKDAKPLASHRTPLFFRCRVRKQFAIKKHGVSEGKIRLFEL